MSVNFAKRSACDRCREHKVRCPRIEQNSNSCTRCLRARTSCTTSSARPLGRPRKVPNIGTAHDRSHHRTGPDPPSGRQSQDSTLHTTISLPQTAGTPSWLGIDDSNGLFDFNGSSSHVLDDSSTWQLDEEYDFLGSTIFRDQASIPCLQEQGAILDVRHNPLDLSPSIQSYPSQQEDLVDLIDENRPGPVGNLNVEAYSRNHQFHNLAETKHSTAFLARLNENMARHLAAIHSYPWHSEMAYISCATEIQKSAVNPIVSILQSTSNFASFLQQMRSSSCSTSRSPSRVEDVALDIPMVLMLLAGHLQLIQLFGAIFGRTHSILKELPSETIAACQPIPGLNLGGLPITEGHLHIKIILQVFEHNLQKIERCIGLPPEYRLYERQDSDQGILKGLKSPMLLQAVLEQANGTRGISGVCHIASLKDNIQKVQGMLHI